MAEEDIDVRARLSAEDEASPKIMNLLNRLKRLEKQLNSNKFTQKRLKPIVSDDDIKKVQKLTGFFHANNGGFSKWASDLQKMGKLTSSVYAKQLAKVEQARDKFENARSKKDRLAAAREYKRAIQRATSVQSVWNRAAEQRERLQERHYGMLSQLAGRHDVMTRQRERERQRVSERAERGRAATQRYLQRVRNASFAAARREEEREERASHSRRLRETKDFHRRLRNVRRSAMGMPGRLSGAGANYFTSPAFYGMMAAGATGAAGAGILKVESDVDAAQMNSRIYGGLNKQQSETLRRNAEQWAVELGSDAADMMKGYTDALKAGIPERGAESFTRLSAQAAEGWEQPVTDVSDFLGRVNTIIGGLGEDFDADKLRSVANTLQYQAAKTATTPERMMSFMRRGAGAAKALGMSQEAGLAFGAASTSLGNEGAKSGRMFDYLSTFFTVQLQELTRGSGRKSDRGKLTQEMLGRLGYGSYENLNRIREENPDEFIFDFMRRYNENFSGDHREKLYRELITQTEWFGEFGRMLDNPQMMEEVQRYLEEAKEYDALGEMWNLHTQKLQFTFKQIRAAFLNIMGEFGRVLSPLAQELGDFFMDWSTASNANLHDAFDGAIRGVFSGLLGRDVADLQGAMSELLGEAFGSDGMNLNPQAFYEFFKGFTEGLKNVWETMLTVFDSIGDITGLDTSSAEGIGYLISSLMGLGVALNLLRPVTGVLGGVSDFMIALFGLLGSAKLIGGMLGGMGGGAMVAGLAAPLAGAMAPALGTALAGALAGGIVIAGLVGVAALAVTVVNWSNLADALKASVFGDAKDKLSSGSQGIAEGSVGVTGMTSIFDYINATLGVAGSVINRANGGMVYGPGTATSDSIPARLSNGEFVVNARATSRNRGLLEAINSGRGFAAGGYVGSGSSGPGQNGIAASLSSIELSSAIQVELLKTLRDDMRRDQDKAQQFRSQATLASLTARSPLGGSFLGGGGGGGSLGGGSLGGGGSHPLYNTTPGQALPSMGGGALGPGRRLGGSARTMLDAIARAEGTSGPNGYNTSLGYGRFLPGGQEQNLTGKSLAEIYQLGLHMRRQPGNPNSSALGRYQIVGSTMKDAAKALGMDLNTTKFDAKTQDRMAQWIAKSQGLGAWEGFKRNRGELATARGAIRSGALTSNVVEQPAPGANLGAEIMAPVSYANQNATRNRKITDTLMGNIQEAVGAVYGEGYRAEVYSGGQAGRRRTGSNRHNDHGQGGRAADTYIYGPDGKRLRGDKLAALAQYWLANQKGSVGLEMNGGGIHLDEITKDKLGSGQSLSWFYNQNTAAQRRAVAAGLQGHQPQVLSSRVPQSASALASGVPTPSAAPRGQSAGMAGHPSGGSAQNVTINIQGAGQSPEEIASAVERRLNERRNWQRTDVEHFA